MWKSGLKTGGHDDIFWVLAVKRSKIYKSWTYEAVFVYILGFIFYGVSLAETALCNKWFNFAPGSFCEQDHLLNLIILVVYAKRWLKCARISKQKLM